VPTHAPRTSLSPALAREHVAAGNAAFAEARSKGATPPPPAPRPAGTGRWVCAVIVCADVDLDVPAALGLARSDVLLISTPGPFVDPETVALVEQAVAEERLSLVLVLSHEHCRTLAIARGNTPQQDAVAARIASLQAEAARTRAPLVRTLVRSQREQLLVASDALKEHVGKDTLRILPGELDARTGAIRWHHDRADALPMPPVK
jgi:carbonic anhydrase